MKRLVTTDKPKRRLEVIEQRTRRRIDPKAVERGLGAERVVSLPSGAAPVTAYALRQQLYDRLRSTGGRPSLEGADIRPKIPMRRARWLKLEALARSVQTDTFHPSPAQLASVILDAAIEQFEAALHLDSAEVERRTHEIEEEEQETQLVAKF
jgi:hypothetical protein